MFKKFILTFLAIFFALSSFAIPSYANDINTDFFKNFNDEYLTHYIIEALDKNNDLKIADAKVEQYRQNVKISFSKELPSLSVGANYLGLHLPDGRLDYKQNGFVLPFVASYEADLLLKNRDKTRSAKKTFESVKDNRKTIYIALLSDVATNYINIIQYDYLINNQKHILTNIQNQLNRAQLMFNQGLINNCTLDSAKQSVQVESNKLVNYKKQQEIILNNFALLVGTNDISNIKRGKFTDFEYQKQIPNEIESDIIFSRPDVLASEKNLEAAKIDIRVARKEFLPRFNITGIWAFNTLAEGSFFSWESSLAYLLAGATMDIFKGGQKVANLKLKKAKYEELFEQYRKTDLNAVKEVNTSLCIIKQDSEIDKNTLSQLNFEENKFKNTNKKYEQGLISYSEKLDSEKNLLLIKQNKVNSKTQRLIDYITLYKAVGGAL